MTEMVTLSFLQRSTAQIGGDANIVSSWNENLGADYYLTKLFTT
jgi:hypothetical protein